MICPKCGEKGHAISAGGWDWICSTKKHFFSILYVQGYNDALKKLGRTLLPVKPKRR